MSFFTLFVCGVISRGSRYYSDFIGRWLPSFAFFQPFDWKMGGVNCPVLLYTCLPVSLYISVCPSFFVSRLYGVPLCFLSVSGFLSVSNVCLRQRCARLHGVCVPWDLGLRVCLRAFE